jgi:hypothetical protein
MASIFKLRRGSGSASLTDGELYIDYNDSLKYTDNLNVTHSLLPLGKSINGNINLTGSISLNGSITASDIYVDNNLFISGNLTVQGTQTSLNVNEVYIEDKTLTLASGSANSSAADGAGIHIAGANVSMSWHNARSGMNLNTSLYVDSDISGSTLNGVGNVTLYSASVNSRLNTAYNRLDVVEATASLYVPFSTSVDSRLDLVEYSASFINNGLNTLTTNLNGVVSGSLQISALGFISASQTSSMNVNSASYALTASYALNAGTTVNTGSLMTTSSFNSFSQSIVSRVSSLESGGGGSAGNSGNSGSFLYEQASPAITWSITHDLNYEYPSVTVYDSNNKVIIPDEITSVSVNALTITFASAEGGWAHISIGGGVTSTLAGDRYLHTQSNASNSWAITHSLDFKYVNIDVYDSNDQILLPQTITAQDANTTVVTFATPTSGNAIISKGGATLNLENINIDSSRYLHIQSTAATMWSVTHSLEYDYPSVTVYDGSDKIIIPDEITRVSNNRLTISFASAETGNAHISVGGISNLAGDRYLHTQSSVSNNWVISHNLNWQYVNIDVYDANNQLLIPQSVTATDANTTTIVFAAPTSGKAIISKGGATVNSPLTSNGPNAYILAGALEVVGNVTATGYITTSDIRLKTNLEEVGDALYKIEQLNAYTYDWIDTYNSDNIRQIGLISQEVKEVQPELVYEKEMLIGDQLERVLLLDYSKVTTLLIGAVKELSNKVKELERNRF